MAFELDGLLPDEAARGQEGGLAAALLLHLANTRAHARLSYIDDSKHSEPG